MSQILNDDHELILIGGLHRSGTTLFASCMARHSQASGFKDTGTKRDEGQFLQPVYAAARNYGGPGRFGLDPRAHLTEASELATQENGRRILEAWGKHWDLSKRLLVEKSPPNLLKTRFLQALFPAAHQVMLLRHPVAACLATRKWVKGGSLADLLEHWVHCHEILQRDREHVAQLSVLSYESFVAQPDIALGRIYRALGVTPESAGLDVRREFNEKYFEIFRREQRSIFSGRSLRRAIDALETRVQNLGYSLVELQQDQVDATWDKRCIT